ncbi:DUF1353 domain-containing protein [Treponema sp. R6D11]
MELVVTSYSGSLIKTSFLDKGVYKLAEPVECNVYIEGEGRHRFIMEPGFPTNMRSGSHCIDGVIPKFTSNNDYNLAILVHDFNYTRNSQGEHYVSREFADNLLREMTRHSKTLNAFQRALMFRALRMFGNSAYESYNDEEKVYKDAGLYMSYRYYDK